MEQASQSVYLLTCPSLRLQRAHTKSPVLPTFLCHAETSVVSFASFQFFSQRPISVQSCYDRWPFRDGRMQLNAIPIYVHVNC